jgi:O-antigen/teichoic acid export membrane protein
LTVFFIGLFTILNYTNNRFKLYKDISKSNILKSIFGAVFQLLFGFLKAGISGLIIGQMASQITANTKLFSNIKKTGLLKEIKKRKSKGNGKKV